MPSILYISEFNLTNKLAISPSDLRANYLLGINLVTKSGESVSDHLISEKILDAQEQLEDILSLKLVAQVFEEQLAFYPDDIFRVGFIKTSHTVSCPIQLHGFVGNIKMIEIPVNALSVRKPSDERFYSRNLYFLPVANSLFYGLASNYAMIGPGTQVGNYWHVKYVTGWKKPPRTLLSIVAKLASINLLTVLSDGLLPYPGATSQSVSLDGLSQSISTTNSSNSGLFGARISQYLKDLTKEWSDAKNLYSSINFTVS